VSKPAVKVVVTDGNGSIGAVFSGAGNPRATITIREGDCVLERTYCLPKKEEGMTSDELAVLRDVFVLNRWKELVVNYFPGLVGMLGGPDLDACEECGQPVPVMAGRLMTEDEAIVDGFGSGSAPVAGVTITDAGREFAASMSSRTTWSPERLPIKVIWLDDQEWSELNLSGKIGQIIVTAFAVLFLTFCLAVVGVAAVKLLEWMLTL